MSVYENLTETQQFACRVIADHARSTAFAIADGILPGNDGRNYVLRKIMRRAIYHGREHLGMKDLFFHKVCDFVIEEFHGAFPELEVQKEFIGKMVRLEEERFASTLTEGLKKLALVFPNIESNLEKGELEPTVSDLTRKINETVELSIKVEKMVEDFGKFSVAFSEKIAPMALEAARITKNIAQHVAPLALQIEEIRHEIGQRIPPMVKLIVDANFAINTSLKPALEKIRTVQFDPEFEELNEQFEKIEDIISSSDEGSTSSIDSMFFDLAKLYDTYGTPRDLIRLGLEERGYEFDEDIFNARFDTALQALQQQGDIGKTARKSQISPIYAAVQEKIGVNNFHGYDTTNLDEVSVVALIKNEQQVETLAEGEEGLIVLNDTPFYAEAGGQVGDTGSLVSTEDAGDGFAQIKVIDTFSPVTGLILHKSKVEKGSVSVGDKLSARVDAEKRDATRRNHTATHLVHAALREVLGTHVKQGGSVVAPTYLRFDFTHYQPMTQDEIAEIEDLVNRYILQNEPVTTNVMAIEEAMRGGAMALFGEKYGADVRVLSVGDGIFSKELCGGTHVRATGDIGSFKITGDEAIASGVRRIRAITGFDAFQRFREDERLIDRSLGALKTQRDNLPNAIERLQEELKRTRKEMDDLKLKIATGTAGGGAADGGDEALDISGVKVVAKIVEGLDANATRQLSDTLLARLKSGVIVLGRKDEGKVGIIVRVSPDLTGKVKAGEVIREIAPIVGGRGGGKPDMAEGGGSEPEKLSEAIEASYGVIEKMLG